MVTKKKYEAPKVQKVQLVIENAVLGVCHASPNLTPINLGCGVHPAAACWEGPGG